jgi:uncharacterized protein YcbX
MPTTGADAEPQIGRVEACWIYPIKSCRGVRLDAPHPFTKTGLLYDRTWCVIKANAYPEKVLTLREHPELATICPYLETDVNGNYTTLILSKLGSTDTVSVPLTNADGGEQLEINIELEVKAWLFKAIGIEARLVRRVGCFDAKPFSAIFQESVEELGEQLEMTAFTQGVGGLSRSTLELVQRFRPNFVLSGFGAWPERRIGALAVGGVLLSAAPNAWKEECLRVTCVHPMTGELHPEQPAQTLRRMCARESREGAMEGACPVFGMLLSGGMDKGASVAEGHIVIAEPSAAMLMPSAAALAEAERLQREASDAAATQARALAKASADDGGGGDGVPAVQGLPTPTELREVVKGSNDINLSWAVVRPRPCAPARIFHDKNRRGD